MAGARKRPNRGGRFQGWFVDAAGKLKFFTGVRDRRETLRMAQALEDQHRQVALGYREPPKSASKHKAMPYSEATGQYTAWGTAQGGRGGRAWGRVHARMRKSTLTWWGERLNLRTLSDLADCLPRVEAALRELQSAGRSGKTLQNCAESLKAFCAWAVERGYLADNPLARLGGFNTTPQRIRRLLDREEVKRLLDVCPADRKLLYMTAAMTGLRAGELAGLRVSDLNPDLRALSIRAEIAKSRKPAIQPLPAALYELLKASASDKPLDAALLAVPTHTARTLDLDLTAAGIPKTRPGLGVVDFHAFRVFFISAVIEGGASVKEAQTLARHSTPAMTLNTYGRTRRERLCEAVETLAAALETGPAIATSLQREVVGLESARDNQGLANPGSGFDSRRLHHSTQKGKSKHFPFFAHGRPKFIPILYRRPEPRQWLALSENFGYAGAAKDAG